MGTEQKLSEIRARLEQLDPNSRDHLGEISNLKTQEAELVRQLEQEQAKLAREQQHVERLSTSAEKTAYALDELEYDGIKVRDLFTNDDHFRFTKMAVQEYVNGLVQKLSQQILGAEEREVNLDYQLKQAASRYTDLEDKFNEQGKALFQANLDLEDLDNKRKAAVAEAEDWKGRYEQKDSELDEARKEYAVGAREAWKVVDPDQQRKEMRELAEKIRNSRIKVINMHQAPDDFRGATWVAELLETGKEISFNYLEKGKYVEVTPEEAERFRAEAAAASPELVVQDITLVEPVVEIPEVGPVESFREEETLVSVHQPSDIGGVVPEAYVTHQELEVRLRQIKEEIKAEVSIMVHQVVA